MRTLLALAAVLLTACGGASTAVGATSPVWVGLELVENTAEGPAFDRCKVESRRDNHGAHRYRVFYGEVRASSGAGWEAVRARSGCELADSERTSAAWTLRGSPYLLVDVAVKPTASSEREVRLEVDLTVRRLTGFAKSRAPTYEQQTEKRSLRVPVGDSTLIPLLIASQKETDELRVRELLLRVRVADSSFHPPVEYGEIAVAADVPRASIFLDGGFAGRTSSEGPVVLSAVRAGEREVVVRDPSGREARAVVRVQKGSRANASLTLPQPSGGQHRDLRPIGRNPQGSEEFWREKDGAIVVRIPGGEFRMGTAEGTEGEPSERPQHVVRVEGFLMDKTEVTWGQCKLFATQTHRTLPKAPVWGMPETFPASNITWNDASAFCAWVGGRLPTEAEWERAARGSDARRYPWGDDWDPSRCNTQEGGPHAPTPAASYPDCASPFGVLDLAGSVWEWCADWYDDKYYAMSPPENPQGPESGRVRTSRGGSWINPSSWVRSAYRYGTDPNWADPLHGFRCIQDDPGAAGK